MTPSNVNAWRVHPVSVDSPGFSILDHPADLGIEARGRNLGEAFEQAALGLTSIIIDPATITPSERIEVDLTASDRQQLLVRWLSEILYFYDAKGFVARRFEVKFLTDKSLRAEMRGESLCLEKHITRLDVKAVTYHQLQVEENASGGHVRVYVDI